MLLLRGDVIATAMAAMRLRSDEGTLPAAGPSEGCCDPQAGMAGPLPSDPTACSSLGRKGHLSCLGQGRPLLRGLSQLGGPQHLQHLASALSCHGDGLSTAPRAAVRSLIPVSALKPCHAMHTGLVNEGQGSGPPRLVLGQAILFF